MNARVAGSLVALLFLAAGCAAWRAREARVEAENVASVAAMRGAEIDRETTRLHERLTAVEQKTAQLRAQTESKSKRDRVRDAVAVTSQKQATLSEVIKQAAEEAKRPEAQVRALATRRAGLVDQFAPFYRRARLAPPQVQAFEDIWMRREESHGDLNAAAQSQDLSLSDPAVAKLRGEIFADYERAQRQLLGEAAYRELQDYERATSAWNIVRHVSAAATVRGVSLSREQMDGLADAIANASASYRSGQSMSVADVDWGAVEVRTAEVLSARQWEFVRTMEPPGGGLFSARWNAELNKTLRAAKRSGPQGSR